MGRKTMSVSFHAVCTPRHHGRPCTVARSPKPDSVSASAVLMIGSVLKRLCRSFDIHPDDVLTQAERDVLQQALMAKRHLDLTVGSHQRISDMCPKRFARLAEILDTRYEIVPDAKAS
jgi:hypothetical protein